MSLEASRSWGRWSKFMTGTGIDIGCKNTALPNCQSWDTEQGDAQYMTTIPDESFDWVASFHCLEHLRDPQVALTNWWRILKPGGYLIVYVPDEDLYERGVWPPHFNPDHKATFTISKQDSWSPVSYNVLDMISLLTRPFTIYSLQLRDTDFDYTIGPEVDQSGHAETTIEIVLKKS